MKGKFLDTAKELIIEDMSHFPNTVRHAMNLKSGLLPLALFLYGIACVFVKGEYTDHP